MPIHQPRPDKVMDWAHNFTSINDILPVHDIDLADK